MSKANTQAELSLVGTDSFDWEREQVVIKLVTPHEAQALLDARNNVNRPFVERRAIEMAEAISNGRFVFNGDTVRFDRNGKLLDGQHRLWAIAVAGIPAKLLLIFGLDPEVFDTIDVGARRSGGDTVSCMGFKKYRNEIASACQWLTRLQRGDFVESLRPQKVKNADVKKCLRDNLDVVRSVERCTAARSIMNVGILSALHYRVACRDADLAERMVSTLREPAGISIHDPFYVFRDTALQDKAQTVRRSPAVMLALLIKAANAGAAGKTVKRLVWRCQGYGAEAFPQLEIPTKR